LRSQGQPERQARQTSGRPLPLNGQPQHSKGQFQHPDGQLQLSGQRQRQHPTAVLAQISYESSTTTQPGAVPARSISCAVSNSVNIGDSHSHRRLRSQGLSDSAYLARLGNMSASSQLTHLAPPLHATQHGRQSQSADTAAHTRASLPSQSTARSVHSGAVVSQPYSLHDDKASTQTKAPPAAVLPAAGQQPARGVEGPTADAEGAKGDAKGDAKQETLEPKDITGAKWDGKGYRADAKRLNSELYQLGRVLSGSRAVALSGVIFCCTTDLLCLTLTLPARKKTLYFR